MEVTIDNVLEKVVNNRYLSRKDKLNQIRKFLKDFPAQKSNPSEQEISTLEKLKSMKQAYLEKDKEEKIKDKTQQI